MARAKYYIKRQFQGDEPETLMSSTRKYVAEKYLNRLFKNFKQIKGGNSILGNGRLFQG